MSDYLQLIVGRAAAKAETPDLTWRIVFADGDVKRGKLECLGGSTYSLEGKTTYYFSSSQVIRMNVIDKE